MSDLTTGAVIIKKPFSLLGSLYGDIIGSNSAYALYDYNLNGVTTGTGNMAARIDFQTTLQMASLQRARRVEEQVKPLSDIITERNDQLEELGKALAEVGRLEAKLPGDANPTDTVDGPADDLSLIHTMNKFFNKGWVSNAGWTRSDLKDCNQLLKTEIDKLNADSQSDMTRLQGLMDKRDQGFTLASDLITKDCDNISAIIRNVTP